MCPVRGTLRSPGVSSRIRDTAKLSPKGAAGAGAQPVGRGVLIEEETKEDFSSDWGACRETIVRGHAPPARRFTRAHL